LQNISLVTYCFGGLLPNHFRVIKKANTFLGPFVTIKENQVFFIRCKPIDHEVIQFDTKGLNNL